MLQARVVRAGELMAEMDLLEVRSEGPNDGEWSLLQLGCGQIDEGYAEMRLVEGVN